MPFEHEHQGPGVAVAAMLQSLRTAGCVTLAVDVSQCDAG
jgi:hypothetical protein